METIEKTIEIDAPVNKVYNQQIPDERIAWQSTSGVTNAGTVNFKPTDQEHTLVSLKMSYQPEGPVENVGDALGFLSRRVEDDLKRFKEFIQTRSTETGAWRGEIRSGGVRPPGSKGARSGRE